MYVLPVVLSYHKSPVSGEGGALPVISIVPPAFNAYDAVVENEALGGVNVIDVAADAVVAKEADVATEDDATVQSIACVELLTIPDGKISDPLIVPSTDKDPVNLCVSSGESPNCVLPER